VTDNSIKTLAWYKICPFTVHYESVMFYSSGHGALETINVVVEKGSFVWSATNEV
jgi:hypothetical protein